MNFVLVTGCPRSGTTSVARWLLDQPGAGGASESRWTFAAHAFLKEARRHRALTPDLACQSLRGGRRAFYGTPEWTVDKEPLDTTTMDPSDWPGYLRDVHQLGFRLIFMVRDPVATIWSMMSRQWGYSLVGGRPHTRELLDCLENWSAATQQALCCAVSYGSRIQSFERLFGPDQHREVAELSRYLERPLSGQLQILPTKQVGLERIDRQFIRNRTAFLCGLLGPPYCEAGRPATVVLLSGRAAAGKTTLATAVERHVTARGRKCFTLNGYDWRRLWWPELGYSVEDRATNVARVMALAGRAAIGLGQDVVTVELVAPSESVRRAALERLRASGVPALLVHVRASLETCRARDVKGLYGKLPAVTFYEEPTDADVTISTEGESDPTPLLARLDQALL